MRRSSRAAGASDASLLETARALVVEAVYGDSQQALEGIDRVLPAWADVSEPEAIMLAHSGRIAALLRLERFSEALESTQAFSELANSRNDLGWLAASHAARARVHLALTNTREATNELAQAQSLAPANGMSLWAEFVLWHSLAQTFHRARMFDQGQEARQRLNELADDLPTLERCEHWVSWAVELTTRALEPLAAESGEPIPELLDEAVAVAARVLEHSDDSVPEQINRSASGIRALAASLDGRPTEALRVLGRDAFSVAKDLPPTIRQLLCVAAMRAHALVGSIPTARNLDEAASSDPQDLLLLVLEVVRTRERLWLENYAEGDMTGVLHRLTDLLVRLSWAGMNQVADASATALQHQALRTESRTDALTGVGNRRSMDEELNHLLRFSPPPTSLVLIDVDRFKEINDHFTHLVGDQVLRRIANTVSGHLRNGDRLLRFGGDEFVLLLPGTSDEEATLVAERMRAAVTALSWKDVNPGLSVSITTGCATSWSPPGRHPEADAELLFLRADENLLKSKKKGNSGPRSNSPKTSSESDSAESTPPNERNDATLPTPSSVVSDHEENDPQVDSAEPDVTSADVGDHTPVERASEQAHRVGAVDPSEASELKSASATKDRLAPVQTTPTEPDSTAHVTQEPDMTLPDGTASDPELDRQLLASLASRRLGEERAVQEQLQEQAQEQLWPTHAQQAQTALQAQQEQAALQAFQVQQEQAARAQAAFHAQAQAFQSSAQSFSSGQPPAAATRSSAPSIHSMCEPLYGPAQPSATNPALPQSASALAPGMNYALSADPEFEHRLREARARAEAERMVEFERQTFASAERAAQERAEELQRHAEQRLAAMEQQALARAREAEERAAAITAAAQHRAQEAEREAAELLQKANQEALAKIQAEEQRRIEQERLEAEALQRAQQELQARRTQEAAEAQERAEAQARDERARQRAEAIERERLEALEREAFERAEQELSARRAVEEQKRREQAEQERRAEEARDRQILERLAQLRLKEKEALEEEERQARILQERLAREARARAKAQRQDREIRLQMERDAQRSAENREAAKAKREAERARYRSEIVELERRLQQHESQRLTRVDPLESQSISLGVYADDSQALDLSDAFALLDSDDSASMQLPIVRSGSQRERDYSQISDSWEAPEPQSKRSSKSNKAERLARAEREAKAQKQAERKAKALKHAERKAKAERDAKSRKQAEREAQAKRQAKRSRNDHSRTDDPIQKLLNRSAKLDAIDSSWDDDPWHPRRAFDDFTGAIEQPSRNNFTGAISRVIDLGSMKPTSRSAAPADDDMWSFDDTGMHRIIRDEAHAWDVKARQQELDARSQRQRTPRGDLHDRYDPREDWQDPSEKRRGARPKSRQELPAVAKETAGRKTRRKERSQPDDSAELLAAAPARSRMEPESPSNGINQYSSIYEAAAASMRSLRHGSPLDAPFPYAPSIFNRANPLETLAQPVLQAPEDDVLGSVLNEAAQSEVPNDPSDLDYVSAAPRQPWEAPPNFAPEMEFHEEHAHYDDFEYDEFPQDQYQEPAGNFGMPMPMNGQMNGLGMMPAQGGPAGMLPPQGPPPGVPMGMAPGEFGMPPQGPPPGMMAPGEFGMPPQGPPPGMGPEFGSGMPHGMPPGMPPQGPPPGMMPPGGPMGMAPGAPGGPTGMPMGMPPGIPAGMPMNMPPQGPHPGMPPSMGPGMPPGPPARMMSFEEWVQQGLPPEQYPY